MIKIGKTSKKVDNNLQSSVSSQLADNEPTVESSKAATRAPKKRTANNTKRDESRTASSKEQHESEESRDARRDEQEETKTTTVDGKVRLCLGFLRQSTKNKLLNAFLRDSILEYEKVTGKEFKEPVNLYQVNDEFKATYNIYMSSKMLKFTKNEKNTSVACPNCKSLDVIVQYKQFLAGDEVETEVIQCNYCGGTFTNL